MDDFNELKCFHVPSPPPAHDENVLKGSNIIINTFKHYHQQMCTPICPFCSLNKCDANTAEIGFPCMGIGWLCELKHNLLPWSKSADADMWLQESSITKLLWSVETYFSSVSSIMSECSYMLRGVWKILDLHKLVQKYQPHLIPCTIQVEKELYEKSEKAIVPASMAFNIPNNFIQWCLLPPTNNLQTAPLPIKAEVLQQNNTGGGGQLLSANSPCLNCWELNLTNKPTTVCTGDANVDKWKHQLNYTDEFESYMASGPEIQSSEQYFACLELVFKCCNSYSNSLRCMAWLDKEVVQKSPHLLHLVQTMEVLLFNHFAEQ